MKKMMIAAMMLLASSASFAGNSDVLKAILKAKTYTEAAQLLSPGSQSAGRQRREGIRLQPPDSARPEDRAG